MIWSPKSDHFVTNTCFTALPIRRGKTKSVTIKMIQFMHANHSNTHVIPKFWKSYQKILLSPTWDWDLSNFAVVKSRGPTQAKYTWPCKHWFLPSTTLWSHIHYYDVIRRQRQYGKKRMEINVVYCFCVVDFVHFVSRRKIINCHVAGGTWESHPQQASSWTANLGHSDGIRSSLPQRGDRFYYSYPIHVLNLLLLI